MYAPRPAASALPQAPPADSRLAQVTYGLLTSQPEARLLDLGPGGAEIRLGKRATFVLLAWQDEAADALAGALALRMKQQAAKGLLAIGFVGGGDRAREVLEKVNPRVTRSPVSKFHLAADGSLANLGVRWIQPILEAALRQPPPTAEAWAALLAQHASALEQRASERREAGRFSSLVLTRPTPATLTLLVLLVLVFGLEILFGGTQSPPVLLRLGALAPARVRDGEIWRLFSCTFLHGGFLHLLFNGYVLWILGSFLERILGTSRLILLYVLSCLGASLLSLVFLDSFAVGASGGLWGLLGAHAVLAYRSRGLLPAALIEGARKAAIFNLGINVLNSFRPHVDMWAHFGGGAVGAALLLSGVLTIGLPRLEQLESVEQGGSVGTPPGPPGTPILRTSAGLAAASLLVCLALAIVLGRPWVLLRPVEGVATPLPSLGFSLPLPPGLKLEPVVSDRQLVAAGDLTYDPGAVIVEVFSGEFASQAARSEGIAHLLQASKKAPEGARVVAQPKEVVFGGDATQGETWNLDGSQDSSFALWGTRGVTVRYSYGEVEEEITFGFLPDRLVKLSSLRWKSVRTAIPPDYSAEVLSRLQLLPASSAAA
ncbi:MAG: rhomboid family intramembrane serine protease [Acidobacteria bacterium]|nr:rhomboid family intramembrane serine protease [Acidobacteriota bacterium]